jgi:hypothetical protein
VLASATQLVSDSRGVDALVVAGYLAAAAIFAATGLQASTREAPEAGARPQQRRRQYVASACGVAAAVGLGIAGFLEVYDSLEGGDRGGWHVGALLWAASLVVLLTTALLARPLPSRTPAWEPETWPGDHRLRRGLMVSVALVLVAAAAARLIALDAIPLGINADEGDRAASAMSLLSGEAPRNMFASGWFYISNVYFWLLAGVMKLFGVGVAEARLLGAVAGWLTLLVVVAIAYRNFGHRMALLTAVLGSALGVMLQFSRETTEASPTALCWALSVAFLLEAGRRGGTWPWVAAGIAGALSLYFYPSGRLWLVLAALICPYLVLRAGSMYRRAALAGTTATALAALLTLAPFLANAVRYPDEALRRADQVSVFSEDNAARLPYYDPAWSVVQLVWEQLRHSLAIFASTGDAAGFWPTDRPILGPLLTVLVALGLGWFTLSWRHVPRFTIALWFWVGFAGMVATVETPNLQRMATAVPVLPLLAAGVLDATAGRLRAWTRRVVPEWDAGGLVVGGAALLLALGLAGQQARFYFGTYADMDRWPNPTLQGRAVAEQHPGALAMTVGRASHQINSGWIRLLAPEVERAGVPSPGSVLPLALPPTHRLAFVLYPGQSAYLPFLREIYPGGSVRHYTHPTEGRVVSVYRVPTSRVETRLGSLATTADGATSRVPRLGALPSGTPAGTRLRWRALLSVPRYGNYRLRLGPGPARLRLDGKTALSVPAGQQASTATVALARGRHLVTLDGLAGPRGGPKLEWRGASTAEVPAPDGFERWRPVGMHELSPTIAHRGLYATVTRAGLEVQRRLDGTIASCCLSAEISNDPRPFVAVWRGTLRAPRSGTYRMALETQGRATLSIDGRTVLTSRRSEDDTTAGAVDLRAGPHPVVLRYTVAGSPGALEWRWTPPGERESIVPPSALEPPIGAGVGRPVASTILALQPLDSPLAVRR